LEFGLKTPRVPIEDSFDLHSFRPEDVRDALEDYLEAAREKGFREVRIIHGKGRGVRRAEVLRWLSSNPFIADYFNAGPERGGMGATIVVLNPKSKI
jgi:DNA-nicking Smr family endonuclease